MSQNKQTSNPFPPKLDDPILENQYNGSNLLNRPHPEGYTEEWIESLKQPSADENIQHLSLLIFRIKTEWLALPSHSIKEVTEAAFIHRLPHTNSSVLLGITNVQGELLVAISMQDLLGIPNNIPQDSSDLQPNGKFMRNIVFGIKRDVFVFPVDEIYGLTNVQSNTIEPVPISVSKSIKNFFSGIFILPDKLSVGLLDEKLIINSLNQNYL